MLVRWWDLIVGSHEIQVIPTRHSRKVGKDFRLLIVTKAARCITQAEYVLLSSITQHFYQGMLH